MGVWRSTWPPVARTTSIPCAIPQLCDSGLALQLPRDSLALTHPPVPVPYAPPALSRLTEPDLAFQPDLSPPGVLLPHNAHRPLFPIPPQPQTFRSLVLFQDLRGLERVRKKERTEKPDHPLSLRHDPHSLADRRDMLQPLTAEYYPDSGVRGRSSGPL